MKVVTAYRDAESGELTLRTSPDSTVLRTGDPLFVPDHLGPRWRGHVCPAIRISRLGTNIPRRFAGRYFEEATLLLLLEPDGESELCKGALYLLDRSTAPGQWTSADILDKVSEITVGTGDTAVAYPGRRLRDEFEEAISEISRFCTFKTGDILVLGSTGPEASRLEAPSEIHASFGSLPLLNLKIR